MKQLHPSNYRQKLLITISLCVIGYNYIQIVQATSQKQEDDILNILQDENEDLPYTVSFKNELPTDLELALKNASKLIRLSLNKPFSKSSLLTRAKRDKELFEDVLIREGYFDSTVKVSLQEVDTKNDDEGNSKHDKPSNMIKQIDVVFDIEKGEKYTIEKIQIEEFSSEIPKTLPYPQSLIESITKLPAESGVNLDAIHDARPRLAQYFQNKGYPKTATTMPIIEADQLKKTVKITYPIKLLYKAIIQEIIIKGNKKISKNYILNRIQFKKGDIFNAMKLEETKNKLIKSNIVSNIKFDVQPVTTQECNTNSDCPVKIIMTITESLPRSIGAGARYSTSMGIGGQLFWHHNNLLGSGEHLGASFRSSVREQYGKISFDLPDIGGSENILSIETNWLQERTKAYKARILKPAISYTFNLSNQLQSSIGYLYEISRASSRTSYDKLTVYKNKFSGLNFNIQYDSSDSFLDPSKGIRLSAAITPHWEKFHFSKLSLVKLNSNNTIYVPLYQDDLGEGKFIFAGSLRIGYLMMKNFKNEASPIHRYYSGGPGSIRAYGYQKAGPVDFMGVPLGGRSFTEWTTEFRFRVSETIGLATFFEASTTLRKGSPQLLTKNTLYGAGFGIRYYSGIGPIRFDIATPLKRRKNILNRKIDSPVQVSISIGQAF